MSLLLLHIFLPLYILLSHAGIELYLPSLQPPQHRRFFRRRRESLQPTPQKVQADQIHLWYQVPAHEHLQIQRRHHRHNLRVEAAQHAQHHPRPGTDPRLFRAHSSAYGEEDEPRGGDRLGNGAYASDGVLV